MMHRLQRFPHSGWDVLLTLVLLFLYGCLDPIPAPVSGLDDMNPGTPELTDSMVDDATRGPQDSRPPIADLGAPADTMVAAPPEESCNGLDEDNDGVVDEDTELGSACMELGCSGTINCDETNGAFCSFESNDTDDVCNGLDDDCDNRIDEGSVCGAYVEAHCRVWLGWADGYAVTNRLVGPEPVTESWGDCPEDDEDSRGVEVCVGTDYTPRFRRLSLPSVMRYRGNFDDEAGLAFQCEDNQNSQLAEWVQNHCSVYLGHTVSDIPLHARAHWGQCPDGPLEPDEQPDEEWKCTGNGPDGYFGMMGFSGSLRIGQGDVLGIAFLCRDENEPELASAITRSVEVLLGWADDRGRDGPQDRRANWLTEVEDCPAESVLDATDRRCVSSSGDGLFHALHLGGTFDDSRGSKDVLGIALRRRNEE